MLVIPGLARVRGFSLIELLISIVILGVLIVLGIPSFSEWLYNSQIRNAAEGVLHGLQVARSEAVRRNGYTQFILLNGSGNTFEIDGINYESGRGWRVIPVTPPSGGVGAACAPMDVDGDGDVDEDDYFQRHDGNEGTGSAGVAVSPAGRSTITFTPLGWIGSASSSCGDPIGQFDFDSASLPADRSRQLRILVTAGGGIRLCDPQVAAGDPRAC